MKNNIFTNCRLSILFLFLSFHIYAQVGIGTTNPNNSAALDIVSSNSGFLLPRVALTGTSDTSTITGIEAEGLIVYNTATVSDVVPGFYFWNGSKWQGDLSAAGASSSNDWTTTGNSGTTAGTNFIGTTDNVGFSIFTNNTEKFRISNTGRLRSYTDGTAALPLLSWSTDTDTGIYRIGADILGFTTAGSERMRIGDGGNVGINVTADALGKLEIVEDTDTQGALYSHIANTGSTWTAVEAYNANLSGGAGILSSGYYGVYGVGALGIAGDGSTGVSGYGIAGIEGIPIDVITDWAGYFFGDIGVNESVYATSYELWSDERIKSNIEPINNALDIIGQLNPVTYDKTFTVERQSNGEISGKTNSKRSNNIPKNFEVSVESEIGLLAQEVQTVLPQLVKEKKMNLSNQEIDNLMSVNYIGLIPVLIKAIQEQQTQIETLKIEIETLKQ